MYKIERLLVALDLTKMDEVLVKYTSHLAQFLKSEKVYFIHIAKDLELPEELKKNYPDLLAPTDESMMDSMKKVVDKYWETDCKCEISIEVKEGDPSEQILKWVDIKNVDMMVMGRKKELKGGGIMPHKVAKVAHTSLMMVPEDSSFKLNKVVVPVDFSKHSKLVVEQALNITKDREVSLSLLNIFRVPIGYNKTGKSYSEFAKIMESHAQHDFQEFIKKNEFPDDLICHYGLDDDDLPADKIFDFASEQNADMIIMGSKGRTGLASLFLGSVAEKVISYDSHIPLMIIKEKGENMGFIKALLKL